MPLYESCLKQWKLRPPGPEQLLLDEMFDNGTIDENATPESVRNMRNEFKDFSPRVFASHFRKTKAKLGLFASNKRPREVEDGAVLVKKTNTAGGTGHIAELGSMIAKTSKPSHSITSTQESRVEIFNPPYTTWTYTDHQAKTDFVCVVISVFSGKTNMSFELAEGGMQVMVKFVWPQSIFDPKKLFENAVRQGEITMHHPMVHAFESTLLDRGITENSSPELEWVIPLPCKVRREVGSYSSSRIQHESSNILSLKFTAYQKDVIIQNDNRSIVFD